MYGYPKSKLYLESNGYAPSAEKLFVDIKDIIEQTFPRLDQDIIDDAVTDGTNEYRAYLMTEASKSASDQEAKEIFLRTVMKSIRELIRRKNNSLIAFMLAKYRHNNAPLTVNQDLNQAFSSDLLTLQLLPGQLQKMFEPILQENRNKIIPQRLRFPPPPEEDFDEQVIIPEVLIDMNNPTRMDQFLSLSDKLQRQIIHIEDILTFYVSSIYDANITIDLREKLLLHIFDEIYNLSISTFNSNQLERLIINSVSHIIRNSYLNGEQKRAFMEFFTYTINNQDNFTYCQTVKDSFRLT